VFVVVVVEVCGFWNLGFRSFQNSVVWIGCLLGVGCCFLGIVVCVCVCVCARARLFPFNLIHFAAWVVEEVQYRSSLLGGSVCS